MSTENARYAVCRVTSDGRVTRLGPPALTASAAQAAYAGQLREGVGSPLRLSPATRAALAATRQRKRDEELRRWQYETCGDPNCVDCRDRLEAS